MDIEWKLGVKDQGSLEAPFSMPEAIWQVLQARGLATEQEIQSYMKPSLKDLTDPFAMDEMDQAVKVLLTALEDQHKMAIYGDFDLDGTPGLALLYDGLTQIGFNDVTCYQPSRLDEGYGVHIHAIDQLNQQGVKLIVTVDVGITDIKAIAHANSLGIKVIVTDHHLPKATLPEAIAIVNPNKGTCNSGLGHLCGAGVGFYVIWALVKKLKEQNRLPDGFDLKSLLDLYAIATITDMVPLIKENRVLVKHGLKQLETTQRPGLQAAMKKLDLLGKELSSQDVAMKLAPKLNALSRIESDIRALDIFMVEDPREADLFVDTMMSQNQKRVSLQGEAYKKAEEEFLQSKNQRFAWIWSETFHQGVVGLVATGLSQKYGVPAFVGAGKKDGHIVCSSRVPKDNAINLLQALEFTKDELVRFGGHTPAAGFELEQNKAKAFGAKLAEYFTRFEFQTFNLKYEYQSELKLNVLSSKFMSWYKGLEPFGLSSEVPLFLIPWVKVVSFKILKGIHWKLEVQHEDQPRKVSALWFFPPSDHPLIQSPPKVGDLIDLLGEPQWNEFRGKKSIQIIVKDLRMHSEQRVSLLPI